MVVYADKPRQAATAALANPALGVTLAGYALSAGLAAEQAKLATCVDLYFETVAFSWNFLKSPGASARPEYELAWQLYHNGLARLMGAGQRFGRLDPTAGLRVITAAGAVVIPTTYHGFVWKPEDFTRIEVVSSLAPRNLDASLLCTGTGRAAGGDSRTTTVRAVLQQPDRRSEPPSSCVPVWPCWPARRRPWGPIRRTVPWSSTIRCACRASSWASSKIAMAMDTSAPWNMRLKNTTYSAVERPDRTRFGGSRPRETLPAGTAPAGQVPGRVRARLLLVARHLGQRGQRDHGFARPARPLPDDGLPLSDGRPFVGIGGGPAA